MSLVDQENDSQAISRLSFGESYSAMEQVRMVSKRVLNAKSSICLWHSINISDFSTIRTFVIPRPSDAMSAYDVDFLSRHEIIPPMSQDRLPPGWREWGEVRRNQFFVRDPAAFRSRLLTSDALIAIPTYRFETLADDIDAVFSSQDVSLDDAVRLVLKSELTGYSYVEYRLGETSVEVDGHRFFAV